MKKVASILLSFVFFSQLYGCSRWFSGEERPGVRVQLSTEPATLDPSLVEDGVGLWIVANLMDGLVGYDGYGRLTLRLAQEYRVMEGGRKFEFLLRPDIRWSDGVPVSAEDFVTGIRRSLAASTGAKLAELLEGIRNAKDFRAGRSKDLGVYVKEGRLVIELEYPSPAFIHALTLPVALPQRKDVLDRNGGRWPVDGPVTGAYRVAGYVSHQYYDLSVNPHDSDQKPAVEAVRLVIVEDTSTAIHLFERGALDVVMRVPSYDVPRFKEKGTLKTFPVYATYYLAFNTRKKPFDDHGWRQAVSAAIDRAGIAEALGTGELPALTWLPPGLGPGPGPVSLPPRKVFRPSGGKRGRIEILAGFDTKERNQLVMEKVQSDLKRELGIILRLSGQDWKSYIRALSSDAPPIYRFGWIAPFADPLPHLQIFRSGNPNNHTGWGDEEYDRLVSRIERQEPGPERDALIRKAEDILSRQAVVVPIYHYVYSAIVSPRLAGFRINPFGVSLFQELGLSN